MASGRTVGVGRSIRTLWGSGAVGTLSDAQLLARFVDRPGDGAEAAFEALVGRHGPMVLRVGRDVLGDRHRVQDVFQATFLILARKAGSIGRPEALAPWLYGVALRVARKARSEAARRSRHERAAAERSAGSAEAPDGPPALALALHEEVARLPEGARAAVVLCYFQGMTYDGAARDLGVTEATVRGRLARARATLRRRLARRGEADLALAPAVLVPDRWMAPTARSVWRAAMGQESTPAAVAGLAEGVLKTMSTAKLKTAAVLIALQVAAGAGVLARPGNSEGAKAPEPPAVAPVAEDSRPEVPEMIRRPDEPGPGRRELTLEAAFDRLVREDPALSPARFEIPMARADALTAGLRADPRYYADEQLVSYGAFARPRPGGQTQYGFNNSRPLDVTVKRRSRLASATRPIFVIEAEYQDAVRLRVNRVASAFVDALAARDLLQLRQDGLDRLARVARSARAFEAEEPRRFTDATMTAHLARAEATRALARSLAALASLLNLGGGEADRLEVVGNLSDNLASPPLDAVVAEALAARPDLAAMRLGMDRAKQDVILRKAGTPLDPRNPLLWALGEPIPAADRRPGRESIQAQRERRALENAVAAQVLDAWHSTDRARLAARKAGMAAEDARGIADLASIRYREGGRDLAGWLDAFEWADETGRLKIEALARLRRAQVALNTAVGRRVVP